MPPPSEPVPQAIKRAGLVLAGLALAILAIGAYVRFSEASDLRSYTAEAEIPTVALVRPSGGGKDQALVLPGTLQAFYDARIYAQVPGYLHGWTRDIGAAVKKGEVLATIDTPTLDQQILQARADLEAALSAQKLSAVTALRWRNLAEQNAVARQDVDEKQADLAAKTDATNSARANLARMEATKAFARITAPFDGIVTQRNVDVGALVGDSTSGNPLFAVSDTHALRLYVNVPQAWSAGIVPGMVVSVAVPEYPGRMFPGRLLAASGAIIAQSSTMLVQFEVSNPDGLLKPGGFAQVSLAAPRGQASLRLPASALLFRAEGLRVATLGPDGRVLLKPITIAADLGTQVVVSVGLVPGDRVVNNPPDSLADGERVRVQEGGDAN